MSFLVRRFARSHWMVVGIIGVIVGSLLGIGGMTVKSWFEEEPETGPHIDAHMLVNSFTEIGELSTLEVGFAGYGRSDDSTEVLGFSLPLTGKSFTAVYEGTVKVGIADVSQITVDVDDSARTITLTAPDPVVTNSGLESIEYYDENDSLFNQSDLDDATEFENSVLEAGVEKLLDGGLIDKARTRTQEVLSTQTQAVLKAAGVEGYTVEVSFAPPAGA